MKVGLYNSVVTNFLNIIPFSIFNKMSRWGTYFATVMCDVLCAWLSLAHDNSECSCSKGRELSNKCRVEAAVLQNIIKNVR